MKKSILFLCYIMSLTLLGACTNDSDDTTERSGDDGGVNNESNPPADKGKNNTKDLVVTGGIEHIEMGWDANFTATINGYVNLTDSIKLLYGSLLEFGIEVSKESTFPSDITYGYMGTPIYNTWKKKGTLKDNRQFTIDFGDLQQNTKYYYRSYIQTNNNMPVYGSTDTFTTGDIESMIKSQKMQATRGPWSFTYEGDFYIATGSSGNRVNVGAIFSTDKSHLTTAKVSELLKAYNEKGGDYQYYYKYYKSNEGVVIGLNDAGYIQNLPLEYSTTYYYAEFQLIMQYPVLSDIGNFKTKAYYY